MSKPPEPSDRSVILAKYSSLNELAAVIEAAKLYVQVDGPDRTWQERKQNHEWLGRALQAMGVKL